MAGVREEEFDEGDVWDVLLGDHHQGSSAAAEAEALVATPPRNRRVSGGGKDKKKGAAAAERDGVVVSGCRPGKPRSSAPVAIPAAGSRGGGEEEEEDGAEMLLLPPHEWLARKMERMGVASPPDQACRGRSKGRELTKVRDAVLPKTAFSDQ
ncbi:hypothetical protein SEVIR_2G340800v4 [Setaria viridis]|uniref:Uncharacterized protein n=2 Tax=Setaria TaxID=4554 RepID=K4A386_SETIT|nr:uncharacterized protein LOC101783175 [Setaria italica]XP_034582650.1 uncharacterized protein LOC117845691 [Setaria viridis]RCV13215.1 hypothetical protein SETIT_2G329900v2 [Setaria italica]TKW34955.1 hypothetical protein SEVIR_2G340800v2 [Setaria viridis]